MASLMMTISSDEEDEKEKEKTQNPVKEVRSNFEEEVDSDFEFGGILGEDTDGDGFFGASRNNSGTNIEAWSYKSALAILAQHDKQKNPNIPARTEVASIIAAARKNMKKQVQQEKAESDSEKKNDDNNGREISDDDDNDNDDDVEETSSADSGSDSDDDEIDDNDAQEKMELDLVRDQTRKNSKNSKIIKNSEIEQYVEKNDKDDKEEEGNETESSSEHEEEDDDEDKREEAAKAAAFFGNESNKNGTLSDPAESIQIFSQLNLCRPLLRGVANMGFVTPTPIQASVIPPTLSGRDICASAVTGSGKTAAFLLPILEKILQQSRPMNLSSSGKPRNSSAAATRALIITPTRELAAQCLGMLQSLSHFCHNMRSCLIVGGNRNIPSQATELRTHPDIVICTPGRMLDHLTNSPGVDLDDLEFLVLDEADRLLDLGFQEEILEIVKSCPNQRQTLLFSATMNTKVDDLVKLSLKRPIRVKITNKDSKLNRKNGNDSNSNEGTHSTAGVEIAPRLEQEFIRIRPSNEDNREAILLSLLTRTFKDLRTIVFFDTKSLAHRLRIICGLCGIKCAELHGNLTQTQRLEALEEFRQGDVNVLLATDLAARGLDINGVQSVINFDMPNKVETYVHRIGRTARAGRGGKSCTMIGEGRRSLMKEVMKDAEEKNRLGQQNIDKKQTHEKDTMKAIIRSRTVPSAVIFHFRAKINSLEENIKEVQAAEAVAKMDRLAEMEATRASNIIRHSEEIQSRPAREWFKGNNEKKADEERLREMRKEKVINQEGTGKHRMSRKKRRAREAKESLRHFQEEELRRREENNSTEPIMTERSIKAEARSLKKQEQQREKDLFSRSIHDEDVARQAKLEKKLKKELKRKTAFTEHSLGDADLFDDERIAHAKKPKGEIERDTPQSHYHFTEFDPNRSLKKGGKKSNKSFKSRSKYKRR